MPRIFAVFPAALAALLMLFSAFPAAADTADAGGAFLQAFRGRWSGKGEVVAGRYKGIKFSCAFTAPPAAEADMQLSGSCRSGLFSQPISAKISRKGGSYQGSFNKGAQTGGMDITAGAIRKDSMVLELNREKLNGNMTARLMNDNQLRVTLAVKIDEAVIPVIGMDLSRVKEETQTASAKNSSAFAWLMP